MRNIGAGASHDRTQDATLAALSALARRLDEKLGREPVEETGTLTELLARCATRIRAAGWPARWPAAELPRSHAHAPRSYPEVFEHATGYVARCGCPSCDAYRTRERMKARKRRAAAREARA